MEIWKDLKWINETHQVSSLGRVKNKLNGNIVKQSFNGRNYLKIGLYSNGKQITEQVHILVLTAFNGKRPAGLVARFIDGDKSNVCESNLRWGKHCDKINSVLDSKPSKLHSICCNCGRDISTAMLNNVNLCDECMRAEKKDIVKLYSIIEGALMSGVPAKSIITKFELYNS